MFRSFSRRVVEPKIGDVHMAKQSGAQSDRQNGHNLTCPLSDADIVAARLVVNGHPSVVAPATETKARPALRERLRQRLLRMLGHGAHEGRAKREVEFLECAPELVGALRSGHLCFAHIALASYLARSDNVPPKERAALRREYPDMFMEFEHDNGHILRWYMAKDVFAAAALTDRDDISVTLGRDLPPGSAELVDLLRRCQQVAYTAWHRLNCFDRRQCQNMIFSVIEEALRQLDSSRRIQASRAVRPLVKRLNQAEEFMLRCATRRAQAKYLKGMLAGTVATGLLVGVVALVLVQGGDLSRLAGQLLLVATAGAVGAVVSVLWRMTSGSFRMNLPTLSHEMKGTDVRLMAGLRPVIGLVFALATVALVMGAVIPVDKQSGATQTALFAGIGFLAGFSERLAQDMFVRSGQGLTGVMGDSPSVGPSAGISPPPGARVEVRRSRSRRVQLI
jgi:hypothetical protein